MNSENYNEIKLKEGMVDLIIPIDEEKTEGKISKKMPVFYYKKMCFNRDITILISKIYSEFKKKKITFLDLMAGSGVRAVRLLKEIGDNIKKVYINDLNSLGLRYAEKSLKLNDIDKKYYTIYHKEANKLLDDFPTYNTDKNSKIDTFVDIIDIDPFGSPSKFIYSSFKSIEIGGLLCITATDTPVLFGLKKEQCIRKYLTSPIKTEYHKELGTRILIYFCMKLAHLNELYLQPILSLSSDHFIRLFFIVERGISGINKNIKKFGYYIHCFNCGYRNYILLSPNNNEIQQQKCPFCQNSLIKSGLVWMGELHKEIYLEELKKKVESYGKEKLNSYAKLIKFLELSENENEFPPFYYDIPNISDSMNYRFPKIKTIIESLVNKGFKASRTHFNFQAIKTNANIEEIKKVLKEFN